jgi:hypothetical protein
MVLKLSESNLPTDPDIKPLIAYYISLGSLFAGVGFLGIHPRTEQTDNSNVV